MEYAKFIMLICAKKSKIVSLLLSIKFHLLHTGIEKGLRWIKHGVLRGVVPRLLKFVYLPIFRDLHASPFGKKNHVLLLSLSTFTRTEVLVTWFASIIFLIYKNFKFINSDILRPQDLHINIMQNGKICKKISF